jgi:DNA-binding NarL/FixJ family response regulator
MNDEEISQKLDKIINLMAIGLTNDKNQREKILILSKAGFQPKDIAALLGTTSGTIRVELSTLRNAKKNKSKK